MSAAGMPMWTPATQLALYDRLGLQRGHAAAPPAVRAEIERFLTEWAARWHVAICPRRSSKSYMAAYKALPVVLGRQRQADGAAPVPTRTWIVGPTYELAQKEFRYLWDVLVVRGPRELGWPKPALARDSKKGGDLYILTAWGSEVVGKSADKPQSLLGEAVDCLIVAEAAQLPGDIWTRYLEPTLTTTQGYALFPTTPDAGARWLYELWATGLEGTSPLVRSYTWSVLGNPTYPLEDLAAKEAFYGAAHPVFREQYLGQWVFYAGSVYGHDFDATRNLVDPPAGGIPADWPRIRAIDFGYRDPFVCLWFALTPDGGLLGYREHYQPGRSMAEHAETIRRLSADERVLYTVADPSEAQSIADLRRLGVPALAGHNDRRAGRLLVGDGFRSGRVQFVRGTMPQTVRELAWYRWDTDKDKEGAKEATVGDDHAMDALRYAVMSRPVFRPAPPPARRADTFAAEVARRARRRLAQTWPTLAGAA